MSRYTEAREERRKETGEDFTPAELVNEILDKLTESNPDIWKDPAKTWLDPAAGNGNFLVEVKRRLVEAGHSEQHIFDNMIFGVDLMPDNCKEMIERLYDFDHDLIEQIPYDSDLTGNPSIHTKVPKAYRRPGLKYVFKYNGVLIPNIVCADGLEYDYSFGREEHTGSIENSSLFGE